MRARCLSDSAVAKFKEVITFKLNSMSCLNTTEDSYTTTRTNELIHQFMPQIASTVLLEYNGDIILDR